jgi:undecaprenyl-diphosphatase
MLAWLYAQDVALRAVLTSYHRPWLDVAVFTLSALGTGGSVWLVIAAVMAARRPRLRMAAWQVVLALLTAEVVVEYAIKPLVGRPRPYVTDPTSLVVGYHPTTLSFPSGHAALSMAAATVLAHALPRGHVWLYLLAVAIGCSRIYIGVHYPLDVAVGMLVGLSVGRVVTGGRAWYTERSSAPAPTVPR